MKPDLTPVGPAGVHVHVPTPGDHYSPATGSAVMTVIYELARQHAKHGGDTRLVVGRGTRHDYPVGTVAEVDFPPLPSRKQKVVDLALGRMGFQRRFGAGLYEPAREVIAQDFTGPIFVHNNPAGVPMLRRHAQGAKICLYLHNVVFGTYTRREIRRVLGAADRAICVSEFIAADLETRAGGLREKLSVVHNGVDGHRFAPADSVRTDGDPVVLFLGRILPEKGPDLLLRAARTLVDRQRRFKVRVVGSSGFSAADPLTPYERELRALAEPIRDRVEFRPFVDREEIMTEYRSADIFCAPSNWDDPCPLTVLEGLACGLPMVTSRRGGIPEIGGDAPLYFHPPDVDELAQRLAELLDNPVTRADRAVRARARAERFSWANQYGTLQTALAQVQR